MRRTLGTPFLAPSANRPATILGDALSPSIRSASVAPVSIMLLALENPPPVGLPSCPQAAERRLESETPQPRRPSFFSLSSHSDRVDDDTAFFLPADFAFGAAGAFGGAAASLANRS